VGLKEWQSPRLIGNKRRSKKEEGTTEYHNQKEKGINGEEKKNTSELRMRARSRL